MAKVIPHWVGAVDVPVPPLPTGSMPVTALVVARLIEPKPKVVPLNLKTAPSVVVAISAKAPAELVDLPITDKPAAAEFCILAKVTAELAIVTTPVLPMEASPDIVPH